MKKLLFLLAAVCLTGALGGCSQAQKYYKYRSDFMDTFDTVVTVMAYAKTDAEFDQIVDTAYQVFLSMHRLCDIYHTYDGLNNLKTVNDNAGVQPVKVDKRLVDMLKQAKEWYPKTDKMLNIALGPVLSIWHDYREAGIANPDEAKLPPMEELQAADRLTDIGKLQIDEAASTVYLEEKGMSLDVGGVAKGYATELAAQALMAKGYDSVLISAGGNIRAIGPPKDGQRNKWSVGIKNPDSPLEGSTDEANLLDVAYVTNMSVVSSGVYERYYTVNGKMYHHLIDPNTLMPGTNYKAVTVVTPDSGLADIITKALFLLPIEKSLAYAQEHGVEALWVNNDDTLAFTPGMKQLLRDRGNASYK